MNEQLLKTSGADVSSSRKKTQKNLGGGAGWRPSPLVLPRVEIKYEKHKGCEQKNGQFFTGKFFGGGNNAYYISHSMRSESIIIIIN